MGALGDYIHLQTWGYLGKNPKNQNTIYPNAQSVYNAVNEVQNNIINKHINKVNQKQIEEYQNMLNIYTGFKQRNNKSSGKEGEIEELAAKKMLETVRTMLIEEYPDYAKAYITETYNAEKNPSFQRQEVSKMKELLDKNQYSPQKSNTEVLTILLSKLEYINKCYKNLSTEKKEKNKTDINNYISAIDELINYSIPTDNKEGIISKQIDNTLQDLISSIDIEQLKKAIKDEKIKYKDIQDKFLKIKIKTKSGTITKSLPDIIQKLIKLTQTSINLKRVKGDALEYMLAVATVVGDPSKMAKFTLDKEVKKKISNRVVGTTGVSNAIVNLEFIDANYRDKIQKNINFKAQEGAILITNTDVQEKIDVYVDLGKGFENISVTAKNYGFDEGGEQIGYYKDDQSKGISMITKSPLLSFLQDDTDKSNIMGEFSNHLLNLKIKHPLKPESERTMMNIPINSYGGVLKKYNTLLNKIILIKSIIGEGMLRADEKGLKTIGGATLFVLNNNQTGQIVVKSTAQLVNYCLKNNNGIYSVLYNSSYDDPLQELQYIKQDFKTPNDRIADIIMKLYNIKVTVKLNINFNDFADLNLTT